MSGRWVRARSSRLWKGNLIGAKARLSDQLHAPIRNVGDYCLPRLEPGLYYHHPFGCLVKVYRDGRMVAVPDDAVLFSENIFECNRGKDSTVGVG
jgi:hypothetical protein